jgi:hypothetical protein
MKWNMSFEFDYTRDRHGGGEPIDMEPVEASSPDDAMTRTFKSGDWSCVKVEGAGLPVIHHYRMKDAHVTVFVSAAPGEPT